MMSWKCWRDGAHETRTHPTFGWPQCAACGAAPQYHERGKYLPEDFRLTIYAPAGDDTLSLIERGSGMVGLPSEVAEDGVVVYYEGWKYGAMQYQDLDARGRWEAGLLHAADRMITAYPTAAMTVVPNAHLKAIGTYNPRTHELTITDEEALASWLT